MYRALEHTNLTPAQFEQQTPERQAQHIAFAKLRDAELARERGELGELVAAAMGATTVSGGGLGGGVSGGVSGGVG